MRQQLVWVIAAVVVAWAIVSPSPASAQVRFVLPVGGGTSYFGRPNIYTSPYYGGYGGGYGGLGYRGSFYPYGGAAGYPYGVGYPYGSSAFGYRGVVAPGTYGFGGYGVYDPWAYGYPGGTAGYAGTAPFYPGQWGTVAYSSGTAAPRMRNAFSPAIAVVRAGSESGSIARIAVTLPSPDAEVWFQGVKTSQTGTQRFYESPPLKAGTEYGYEIRARWRSGASYSDQTRTITVRAGEQVGVDFTTK